MQQKWRGDAAKDDPCPGNPFCNAISDESRTRLCEACHKKSYPADAVLHGNFGRPIVVQEGVLCTKIFDITNVMLTAGDFIFSLRFAPSYGDDYALSKSEYENYLDHISYVCPAPVTIATFDTDTIRELCKDPSFLGAALDSTKHIGFHTSMCQVYLHGNSAYESLRFLLKLLRKHGIADLTHAQLATLSDRNRSTVTKVMQEIALGEPELLEPLSNGSCPTA